MMIRALIGRDYYSTKKFIDDKIKLRAIAVKDSNQHDKNLEDKTGG